MLSISQNHISCGVIDIRGESLYKTPEAFMKDFGTVCRTADAGYNRNLFIYSHGTHLEIGREIASYIERHRLGTVTRQTANNPVHGADHPICVFVWARDTTRFWEHHRLLSTPVDPGPPKGAETIPVKG